MHNTKLEQLINQKLNITTLQDYTPNGLQVEGRKEVTNIITGVTASQALLDASLVHQADAIIVHHGYFWKNESSIICGMKRRRLKTLLENDINLYSWHLPLDMHPELGNNALLAAELRIVVTGLLDPLVLQGKLDPPINGITLKLRIEQQLKRSILHCGDNGPAYIQRVAWCTGSGQNYISLAAHAGVDAFITGDYSEQAIHVAREMGLHFYAAGHHATERSGIRSLGDWLAQQYDLRVTFIDIPNPA